jgi:hypothetical protein
LEEGLPDSIIRSRHGNQTKGGFAMTVHPETLKEPTSILLGVLCFTKPGTESYREIVEELFRRDRDPQTGGYVLLAATEHRDKLIKEAHEFRSSLKLEWARIRGSDLVVVRDPVINDVELANEVRASLKSRGFLDYHVAPYEKAEGVSVDPPWRGIGHDDDVKDADLERVVKEEILPVVVLLNRLGYQADYDPDIDGSCIHVERGPQRPKPQEVL